MGTFLHRLRGAFALIPAVLLQALTLLPDLWGVVKAVWRRLCRGRRPDRDPCHPSLRDVYVRPDPLLYAQYYLMGQGLAVTWDNPDIALFDAGVEVPSSSLLPDHDYEVRVRVWNGSYSAPALGVKVSLSQLSFGMSTASAPIASTTVDLGVKGTPNHPGVAVFPWHTPSEGGHYCLQAQLDWHDDANPDNNLGQENVLVGTLASPAHFTFQLRNPAAVRRGFVLEADTYRLPVLQHCDEGYRRQFGDTERFATRIAESRARWAWALNTHAYGTFPVPQDWSVRITPSEPVLGPGEEVTVEVVIEPEGPDFSGTKAFNIHGFAREPDDSRRLVGGVTLMVTK